MIVDAVKDFIVPKRFGIVAYACVIAHFLCGLAFIAVTAALRESENLKFSCTVDEKSTATYKKKSISHASPDMIRLITLLCLYTALFY